MVMEAMRLSLIEHEAQQRRQKEEEEKKREMMVNMEMIFTRLWEGECQGDRKW